MMKKEKSEKDYSPKDQIQLNRMIEEYATLKKIIVYAESRLDQVKSDVHDLLGVAKVYNLNEKQIEDFVKIKVELESGVISYILKDTRSTDWERLKAILTEEQYSEVRITNPHSELRIAPKKDD